MVVFYLYDIDHEDEGVHEYDTENMRGVKWDGEEDSNGYVTGKGEASIRRSFFGERLEFDGTMNKGFPVQGDLSGGRVLYEGKYKNGYPSDKNGKLYYKYPNTRRKEYDLFYQGKFIDGKMDGIGKIYLNGKLYYDGHMENNEPSGIGTIYESNINKYIGEIEPAFQYSSFPKKIQDMDIYAQGKGKWYQNGKLLQEGIFDHDNLMEGKEYWKSNGKLYFKGTFKEDKPHEGTYYDENPKSKSKKKRLYRRRRSYKH